MRTAWRDATNEDIAASIIGFIRQAALGDPLVPYDDRVTRAMHGHSGQPILDGAAAEVAGANRQADGETEIVIDRDRFGFRRRSKRTGGFNRLNKVFDGQA